MRTFFEKGRTRDTVVPMPAAGRNAAKWVAIWLGLKRPMNSNNYSPAWRSHGGPFMGGARHRVSSPRLQPVVGAL
jgi:hypothetical protein